MKQKKLCEKIFPILVRMKLKNEAKQRIINQKNTNENDRDSRSIRKVFSSYQKLI